MPFIQNKMLKILFNYAGKCFAFLDHKRVKKINKQKMRDWDRIEAIAYRVRGWI